MSRRTNKVRKINKRKINFSKKRNYKKGGSMTTTVDTDPYSYRENEYKEMNELLLKGGQNTDTPESQGSMTLDELNISTIGSENNTNDQFYDNEISGFAQDPDEGLMDTYNNFLQQNENQQNDWFDEGDTDLESFLSQQSSQQSSFPEFSQSTIASDITTGGKQKSKKKIRKGKRKQTKKYNKK